MYTQAQANPTEFLSQLLLILCGKNFIFAPFFFVFLDFYPPSLGEPAQCRAVLCTDIHASWRASTGPKRGTAARKVIVKLKAGVISRNVTTLKGFLYFGTPVPQLWLCLVL